MKIRKLQIVYTRCIILSILMVLEYSIGFTQGELSTEQVKANTMTTATQALKMASSGEVKVGINMLTSELSKIPENNKYDTYRSFLHFNLGYIYNNYGYNESDDYLSKAASHYKTALEYQPKDVKILNNLILLYQQMGEYDSTIAILNKIIKKDPDKAGIYYMALGDAYKSQGNVEEAAKSYGQALKSKDQAVPAGQKLIDLYDQYPNSSLDFLYQQCIEFENNDYLQLAKPGYENLLSRRSKELTPDEAAVQEKALLRWLATTIKLNYVTPDLFKDSGLDSSSYEPLKELQSQIDLWASGTDPELATKNLKWWTSTPEKYFYFLAFEKSYADYQLNYDDPKYAIRTYEYILNILWSKQDYSKPIYGREDVLMTDLIIALARIYNNPKYKSENKWKGLESHIIQEKGRSYETNDLVNQQKFHTILGQIYFERGEFDGGIFKNAKFQLYNAIEVSERRAENNPQTYRPMPNLHQLLAMVYDTLKENENAYNSYVNASLGYLESDNLRKSGEMIKAASVRNQQKTFNESKFSAVNTIYKARVQIPQLDKSSFDENQSNDIKKDAQYEWLSDKSIEDVIAKDVVERQRFKVLSDLSVRAAEVEAPEASAKLSEEARHQSKEVNVMTSRQDEYRLKELHATDKSASENKTKTYQFSNYNSKGSEEVIIQKNPPPVNKKLVHHPNTKNQMNQQ